MTLARLEQALVIAWLAALGGALAWHVSVGDLLGAALWSLGLLTAHAGWLLLTFLFMRWHNRHDPAPPASGRQWLAAWWAEVTTAPRVFGWQQPFRARAEPDHLPAPAARGRVGVVLVHGFVCNRGLWNPWMRRLRRRGVPFVAVNLGSVFGSIDDGVRQIEEAVWRVERATGVPPLLVGHSMGGLAIRAWLRTQALDGRVRGVITLGTPHLGTWLGHLSLATNGRQMRPGSPWLQALAAAEPASRARLFLCGYSHCDNIVFPASNACLPGARHWHIAGAAHVDMLDRPEVFDRLLMALRHGGQLEDPGAHPSPAWPPLTASEAGQHAPQWQGLQPQQSAGIGAGLDQQTQQPPGQRGAHTGQTQQRRQA